MSHLFEYDSDVYCLARHLYRPANLASVADDITFLIMCAMLRTALLFCGMVLLLERKKCPPALLRAFVSLR